MDYYLEMILFELDCVLQTISMCQKVNQRSLCDSGPKTRKCPSDFAKMQLPSGPMSEKLQFRAQIVAPQH